MSFLDDLQDAQAQLGTFANNAQAVVTAVQGAAGAYAKATTPQGTIVGVTGGAPPGGYEDVPDVAVVPEPGIGDLVKKYWKAALLGLVVLLGAAWGVKRLFFSKK